MDFEYKEVEILEADDEGYPKRARMLMDAAIFKDTLIMSYEWPEDRQSLSWTRIQLAAKVPRRHVSLGAQGFWH